MASSRRESELLSPDNLPSIRPNSREQPIYSRGKRNLIETEEQLKHVKEELSRKEKLISQLMSVDVPRPRLPDNIRDDRFAEEQIAAIASARSEVASLQLKVDELQIQLREAHAQLEVREEKIKELKVQVEGLRETETKLNVAVQTLRSKLGEYEVHSSELEGTVNRTEIVIQALQSDKTTAQENIIQLERHVRTLTEEKEFAERNRDTTVHKWNDLVSHLRSLLHVDEPVDAVLINATSLIEKVSSVMEENALLKGRVAVLRDSNASAELEAKANRETINRLVEEAEGHQHHLQRRGQASEVLQQEKDSAVLRQRELEREVQVLQERLDACQKSWAATKKELDGVNLRVHEYHNQEVTWRTLETANSGFKEILANLLSDGYQKNVEPREDAIKERIKSLLLSLKDKSARIELLESKVGSITLQFESEVGRYQNVDKHARRSETIIAELEERLKCAESELASSAVLRDGLRADKQRVRLERDIALYLQFLERICQALKMEPLAADVGMDMACEAIVARAQQAVKFEMDALAESKSHVYQLQRKIKALKEQIDSQNALLESTRNKVVSLETRLTEKSNTELQKAEEMHKNKRLLKLNEQYKNNLSVVQVENRDLKTALFEQSAVQALSDEREKAIVILESQVNQLEKIKAKQAEKINQLKEDVRTTDKSLHKKKEAANKTISALTTELNLTKTALEETQTRERQLVDLRQVLGRMLGCDMNTMVVPDYDIVARLEKLLLANRQTAASAIVMDSMLSDMEDGFTAAYRDNLFAASSLYPGVPYRPMSRSLRPRSRSPTKLDPRAY